MPRLDASPPRCSLALVPALLAVVAALHAQPYPNKPIKIIAPVQPGGGVDLVARTIGERISKGARPAGRRRQPERRRRRHRVADDRARGAGRLHADARLRRDARHEPGRAQASVRRGQGLHADRDGRRHAEHPRRARVGARVEPARIRRLGEDAARASSRTVRRARVR